MFWISEHALEMLGSVAHARPPLVRIIGKDTRMFRIPRSKLIILVTWPLISVFGMILGGACGPSAIQFAVLHLTDRTGEQLTEIVTADEEPALDNSSGEAPLQIEIQFQRNYRYQINERITSDKVSGQSVRDKIVELYKLPPNDPEGEVQTALCPVSVVVPPGEKAKITVEWTERWADGVINEGVEGEGERLGTYAVFLGYIEPCSLVNQDFYN